MTRREVEGHLDALDHRLSFRRWAPYGLVAAALLTGLGLSRLPLVRMVRVVSRGTAAAMAAAQLVVWARQVSARLPLPADSTDGRAAPGRPPGPAPRP